MLQRLRGMDASDCFRVTLLVQYDIVVYMPM